MTKQEWLACGDPERMIRLLPAATWTERRGRLFAVECCRRIRVLPDERLADVIETAGRFADGLADENELGRALRVAEDVVEWEARHDMSS